MIIPKSFYVSQVNIMDSLKDKDKTFLSTILFSVRAFKNISKIHDEWFSFLLSQQSTLPGILKRVEKALLCLW